MKIGSKNSTRLIKFISNQKHAKHKKNSLQLKNDGAKQ